MSNVRPELETFQDVKIRMSQQGEPKGLLLSPTMIRQSDSSTVEFPNRLHIDLYNDSGKVESIVDAKYGRYLEGQKKVLLRDSVVVINQLEGDTLETSELWWNQETEQFYTDKPVIISEPDKKIFGTGLTADQNLNWYNITHINGQQVFSSGKF